MTQEKMQLLMMQGVISQLPKEEQGKVAAIKSALDEIVKAGGDHGILAASLMALEIAAEQ